MYKRSARAQQTHVGKPTQQVSTHTPPPPPGLSSSGEAHIPTHNDDTAAISTDTVPQQWYGSSRHKYRPPTTVRQQCTRSDSTSKIEGECRDTKESPAKHQSAMWRCARRESEANCKAGEGGGGKLSVKPIVQDWAWMANPYLENSQDCKILRTAPNGFFNISLTLITGIRSFLILSLDDAILSRAHPLTKLKDPDYLSTSW